MAQDVTVFHVIKEHRGVHAASVREQDLYPSLAELLEDATHATLDFLTDDLGTYERTGYTSATISRLLGRARCLAEADRIAMKFAD